MQGPTVQTQTLTVQRLGRRSANEPLVGNGTRSLANI